MVTISNKIIFEDYTKNLYDYCERNLKIPNPDYVKKQRMGFWTGQTPKYIYLYEIKDNKLEVGFGLYEELKHFIFDCNRRKAILNAGSDIDYGCNVSLYDYQKKAVDAMLAHGCGILQSKAGSGKTQMAIAMIGELGCKTLWLTHTKDLLTQSYNRASQYIDKKYLGKISDGKVNIQDITFATVQTMAKLDLNELKYEFGCIIVDECHRVAGSPTAATQFYKVLNSLAARYKYGLSATVHRSDGLIKCCFACLGKVKYIVPDELVADRVMPVDIVAVPTQFEPRTSLDTDGTIDFTKLLTEIALDEDRNKLIANLVEKDNITLILSDRICQLEMLKTLLPNAVIVTGKTKKTEREKHLAEARKGNVPVLLSTYKLAKEGLDIPCLNRLIMATPVKDYAVVVQSVGRIARVCENKNKPVCYDVVDGCCKKMWQHRKRHYKKEGCRIVRDIL